jgi:hypothetical protein
MTDRHDISEILLKVALNTIILILAHDIYCNIILSCVFIIMLYIQMYVVVYYKAYPS